MDGKGGFKVAEGGWEEYTTMVYSESTSTNFIYGVDCRHPVDQPAGTGFSYTSSDHYVHSLPEVCGTAPLWNRPDDSQGFIPTH